jgi:hypothetical protein
MDWFVAQSYPQVSSIQRADKPSRERCAAPCTLGRHHHYAHPQTTISLTATTAASSTPLESKLTRLIRPAVVPEAEVSHATFVGPQIVGVHDDLYIAAFNGQLSNWHHVLAWA